MKAADFVVEMFERKGIPIKKKVVVGQAEDVAGSNTVGTSS